MAKLLVENKQVVVPGEELAEGMDYIPGAGAYRDNDIIRAKKLGLAEISGRAIKIISLSGRYAPKKDDVIIGKVIDITLNGWRLDTNSAYSSLLGMRDATSSYIEKGSDLTKYFNIGDYLVVKISNVTSQKLIDVTLKGPGLRKLKGGRIIKIKPSKVPRVIGKGGSMVKLIKDATGCFITVGQNGRIWISGTPEKELIVVEAIRNIEKNAHIKGLTEEINKFLSKVK